MWKKIVSLCIGLVLVVVGVGLWVGTHPSQQPIFDGGPSLRQEEQQPAPELVVPAETGGDGAVQPAPVFAGGSAEGSVSVQRQVQFNGAAFSPQTLTIKKGDTVVFVNNGNNPMWVASAMHPTHTVYPTKGGCLGSTFDACKGYDVGMSWSFTFDSIGSWGYHDHLNPGAYGKIIVE